MGFYWILSTKRKSPFLEDSTESTNWHKKKPISSEKLFSTLVRAEEVLAVRQLNQNQKMDERMKPTCPYNCGVSSDQILACLNETTQVRWTIEPYTVHHKLKCPKCGRLMRITERELKTYKSSQVLDKP